MRPTIKLLCVIEATTVNGPAKNLLNFCRLARSPYFQDGGLPRVEVSIVTFHRLGERAEENGQRRQQMNDPPNSFVAAAREEGVDVQVINERFRFDPQVISALRRIVAKESPDVIQTHMIKSHFLLKLAGLGKQYPWVAYHHGYTATDLKMRAYNRLNRWSLPSATRVITVCHAFANQLSRAGVRADRITVRHNSVVAPGCVPRDEQQTLKHRLGIADDELVVLSVGRLSREKGYSDLLNAIALLRELDSELKFKLVIAGEGPERQRLEQAAHGSGLSARVLFIGHVEDITPYYAIADALALPSHSEGSPNVLLEAMAAGVPVVATSVGGVPEIAITEKSALLVPARDPRLFAAALHRLLTTPELARTLSANAKVRVETHFSPESHAQSLIRIYQELLPIRAELAEGTTRFYLTMRVSVIIPLFNKAPYVERALASVIAQSFTDFEVIVVDDGSTDEGAQIVEGYHDPRIRLIKQSNAGPGGARNRGLDEARGELVAFLDADDEWLPDYLAESVRLLDAYGTQVATITSAYFDCRTGVSSETIWRAGGLSDGAKRLTPDTSPAFVVGLLAYMSPCTTVARAATVRKWGGFYEQDHCAYGEDAHLWLKVLLNENVAVNLKPLARIHFEASDPAQTRRSVRPIEPFLIHPEDIEIDCPSELRGLLLRVFAARALKTACVLGYWGRWHEARDLVRRFRVPGAWRLPYYTPSLLCRTPIGPAIGKLHRMVPSFRV